MGGNLIPKSRLPQGRSRFELPVGRNAPMRAFQCGFCYHCLVEAEDFFMPSRAAAVREIIRRGLAAEGFENAVTGQGSKSFGVIDTAGADASGKTQKTLISRA